MIRKRIWRERRQIPGSDQSDEWTMEGWYLFGFLPLYVRDLSPRGTYGYVEATP